MRVEQGREQLALATRGVHHTQCSCEPVPRSQPACPIAVGSIAGLAAGSELITALPLMGTVGTSRVRLGDHRIDEALSDDHAVVITRPDGSAVVTATMERII